MGNKAKHLRPVPGGRDSKSDEDLVRACARGDTSALGELYDRYNASVFRFLARMSGCDARDLDDLVQNTFLDLARSARRFRGKAAVKTWILGIALNIARNHMRSEHRRKQAIRGLQEVPIAEVAPLHSIAEHRLQLRALAEAISQLPFDLRATFLLCAVEGISSEEAARVLHVPKGTVWRRLHQARASLAQTIGRRRA